MRPSANPHPNPHPNPDPNQPLTVQAGCTYLHNPLSEMNARSKRHGVSHTAAEAFFGLGSGCMVARRATLQHLRVLNNNSAAAGARHAW